MKILFHVESIKTGCRNPPTRPAHTNLVLDSDPTVRTALGHSVEYICANGTFWDDYEAYNNASLTFDVMCNATEEDWEEPIDWPTCVPSEKQFNIIKFQKKEHSFLHFFTQITTHNVQVENAYVYTRPYYNIQENGQ